MNKVIVLATMLSTALAVSVLPSELEISVTKNLTSMPLAFTENQGQWDEKVLFRADAGGATMWFTSDGAYYQFTRRIPGDESRGAQPLAVGSDRFDREGDKFETMTIKASFVGANLRPAMRGESLLDYRCNYFIGNDPAHWRTDVPNYNAVVYDEIYPGIDLKYYGNGKEMEYDFIVSPGADPSRIKIQYEGAESISVNELGELVVATKWGEVIERRPVVYQLQNGARVAVEGQYELTSANSFSFSLNDDYDQSLALVIDPELCYSTYLGGSNNDWGTAIAVDASNCAYVTGTTKSPNFPTENPYQTDQDGDDVFVTKLNSSGNGLVYSTYLGGSSGQAGFGIAVDGSNCAYVTGCTGSSDFPIKNAYQTTYQGEGDEGFVTKLNSSGNDLVYSTYLGSSTVDFCFAIAVDGSNCAYVTGFTTGDDFPTENPYQTNQGSDDVFVTKLNSSGDDLVYSTYLGGNGSDEGWAIAVDGSGCAYVTGRTASDDFPTEDPYQTDPSYWEWDVFVTKLNSSGNGLVYSTYLGGSGSDGGYAIAVDGSGCAYVTGHTLSTNFPTENPYQTNHGSGDVFVTKLNSSGNGLVYSTYLGGSLAEGGGGIALDAADCAYVTGFTNSPDFPTQYPYQDHQGNNDVFVTKLNSPGNGLVYS
ncbi:MAG: SBBP repeat-containing protein, partial [Candidatus Zixiibacteriota bacterium]